MSTVKELRRECLVHRYLYYVLCTPVISDYEYDMLERKLGQLVESSPEEPELLAFCPTRTVGSDMGSSYPEEIHNEALRRLTDF